MQSLIAKYPKSTFLVFSKAYWVVSFFYSIYVIQGHLPSTKQFILGSIFVLLTMPISYWLTYAFAAPDGRKEMEERIKALESAGVK